MVFETVAKMIADQLKVDLQQDHAMPSWWRIWGRTAPMLWC